ncbi:MAG: His/Gly/Thr/Pro-type tRNA ligase C-terminal domain-containing protein, partial [Candidatus Paceibacteria bacterium]
VTPPFGEKEALFTKRLLHKLNLKKRSDLYIVRHAHKQGLVVSPPGPIGLLRMCMENQMMQERIPAKLYSYTSKITYNEEEQGYDQHHVVKSETIGDTSPVRDAEHILLGVQILKEVGFHNITVHINSLGSEECKERYYEKMMNELPEDLHYICEDYKNDPVKMFMVLQEAIQDREDISIPQLIDNLTEECYEHFKRVLEFLDFLEIPYKLNPKLDSVAGFAHKTIFEITADDVESPLIRGGRHDNVFQEFVDEEDEETPIGAVGMEVQMDTLFKALAPRQQFTDQKETKEIFVAAIGHEGQKYALRLVSQVREEGLAVTERLGKRRLKDQLNDAKEEGIELVVIAGRKEALEQTVIIRHRSSENQEIVNEDQLIPFLYQKLTRET